MFYILPLILATYKFSMARSLNSKEMLTTYAQVISYAITDAMIISPLEFIR